MDLQKYHNAHLKFFLPAVNPGYTVGDRPFFAEGVALMTVSGPDVLLHPLTGSRFLPVSALPFLPMLSPISTSPESDERTTYQTCIHPSSFGSELQDGLHLVLEDTDDDDLIDRPVDLFALWDQWKDSSDASPTDSTEE